MRDKVERSDFAGTARFEVRRPLGAGTFGAVFEALDRERGAVVALKVLRLESSETIYRFKREFRALADIVHPNLVLLHELLSTGDQWFYSMERVEGVSFIEHVRPWATPQGGVDRGPTAPDGARDLPTAPGSARPGLGAAGSASWEEAATVSATHALGPDPEGPAAGAIAGAAAPAARTAGVPLPRLDERRLRAALVGLAHGLEALHAAGKLHRDLKPANVLVTAEGRVVILDFGVVAELAEPDAPGSLFGTPAYMSPEQARDAPVSPASDWYCVGVMLYEALTGALPFPGPVPEILRQKARLDPLPPEALVPGLPEDLAALCRDLLRRDAAARPTGHEVLARLGAAPAPDAVLAAAPAPAPGAAPEPPVAAPPFVGRDRELAELLAAFEATNAGRTVAVRVQGRSGIGKSGLLRRFLEEVARRDPAALILAGRCYERESVPFKALDTVVDALSRRLQAMPRDEVNAMLPADVPALTRLFPVLKRVAAVAGARRRVAEPADPIELRRRAFAAFRGLLVRLASRVPLVLAVDDLQWGDADGARLLHDILKPPDAPPLLFVAVHRAEEATAVPVVEALRDLESGAGGGVSFREVVVGELPFDDACRLAESLLGPGAGAARARAIAAEAGGSPLFIDELVRHAVEAAPGPDPGPGAAAGGAPSGARLDDAIRARVASLPAGARRLVETIAVAARPIDLRTARLAAGLGDEGAAAERLAAAAHLIRTRGPRPAGSGGAGSSPLAESASAFAGGPREVEEAETYHDRVREAVVSGLPAGAQREIHARLAAALVLAGDADPETLAAHCEGAGDRAAAARHAEEAARRAAFALAFDRAARLYGRALELSGATGEAATELTARRAEALANARRPADAAVVYLEAAMGAGRGRAVELKRRAAELLLMNGDIDGGLRVVRTVLGEVGLALPEGRVRAVLQLLWLRARVRWRGLGFVVRAPADIPEADLLRVDTAWSVATGIGAVDLLRGALFHTRQLLLALEAGEPFRIARALALEAVYVSGGGGAARAARSAAVTRAAADLAGRLDSPYAQAFATVCGGGAAFNEGRFRDAASTLEGAVERLSEGCEGATWELGIAQFYLVASLYYLGEWGEVARRVPALLEEAQARGDRIAARVHRNRGLTCALLAADEPERVQREVLAAAGPVSRDLPHLQDYRTLAVDVEVALYCGRGAEAARLAATGRTLVRRSVAVRLQVYRIEARDLYARAALAGAAEAAPGSGARAALVRAALREARRIEREGASWASPLALLLRGGAAALGDGADAASAPDRLAAAERGLEAADLRLHAAAARRRRGEVAGGAEGRDLIAAADAVMAAQGIRNPARVAALLAPGEARPRPRTG